VCGRSQEQHRLRELKPPAGIEIDEPGVIGDQHRRRPRRAQLEQVGMPDGRISKRVMVTVKIPF
jgi:hypothetical protein